MNTNQVETRPLRDSPSTSSLSTPSKNILSFTKLRKSTSKLSLLMPQPELPEAPTQELQQATSRRNYVGNRNTANLMKQPSLRRKGSTRAHAPAYPRKRPSTAPSATTSTQDYTRPRRDEFPKPLGSSAFPTTRMSNQPTTRSSIMQRFSRRPRRSNSSERAELPIQRAPSAKRQSIRVSTYRNSRALSHRSSLNRPGSRRYSRPVSTLMNTGYQRSFSVTKPTAKEAYKEDAVSDFSTDSEDETQITMRGPRIERTRASAQLPPTLVEQWRQTPSPIPINNAQFLPTLAEQGRQTPSPIPASMLSVPNKSLADLIEELSGEIDQRGSRATMDSVLTWDLSLDHYCNAFPSPPTPGLPHTPQTPIFTESVTGCASLSSSRTTFTGVQERDVDDQLNAVLAMVASPRDTPSPSLAPLAEEDQFGTESKQWEKWHFPRRTSSLAYPHDEVTTSPKQRIPPMPSMSSLNHVQSSGHHSTNSIASSLVSGPTSPTTSTLPRPRSVDRLAQARRRTRIIFGEVVDGADGEEPDLALTPAHGIEGSPSPLRAKASMSTYPSRRGSDKSSVLSSMGSSRVIARGESEALMEMRDDAFSLNSSDDDASVPIGVALTTETREVATPSPIAFTDADENGLTLFARRKKRNAKLERSRSQLRVKPPPPVPPLPGSLPSTAALSPRSPLPGEVGVGDTSPSPLATHGHHTPSPQHQSYFPPRAGSATAMHMLASTGSRTTSPQPPPISAPPKRKSFFRYPFSSKRHSSKLSSSNIPGHSRNVSLSRRESPPPPSPRAKVPPMSANATRSTFWSGRSLVGGTFSAAKAMKTVPEHHLATSTESPSPPTTHSTGFTKSFRSFSRPSLSGGSRPLFQS